MRSLKNDGIGIVDQAVRQAASNVVYACDVGVPLRRVWELMDKHPFRHLPIKNGHRLCGTIHMLDVVQYRLHENRNEAEVSNSVVSGSAWRWTTDESRLSPLSF